MEALDRDIEDALNRVGNGMTTSVNLPHRLGLSRRHDARWSDFVQMPPNRDLPCWVNDHSEGGPHFGEARVAAFDRAHHIAVGWGLVADRLDDNQVQPSADLGEFRRMLLDAWRESLHVATDDRLIANSVIDNALDAWSCGVSMERSFFTAPRTAGLVEMYARSVQLRLRWVTASAAAMLMVAGLGDRVEKLRATYEMFLYGLQCRDDAFDADDDRHTRGAAVHEVLGIPRGGLVRAAPSVLRRSAARARHGGFIRLAVWIGEFAESVDVRVDEPDLLQSELAGMMISSAVGGAP